MFLRKLLEALGDQSRALENARTASTQLARRRVEREEVEIFLALRYPPASEAPAVAVAGRR